MYTVAYYDNETTVEIQRHFETMKEAMRYQEYLIFVKGYDAEIL